MSILAWLARRANLIARHYRARLTTAQEASNQAMRRKIKKYEPSSSFRVAERLRAQREFAPTLGEVFPAVRSITIAGTMTNFDVQKFSKPTSLRVGPEDKFPLHIECICHDCEDGGESHGSGITFKRSDFQSGIADKKARLDLRGHCWGWGSRKYRNVSHCSVTFEGSADIEYSS